MTVDSSIEYEIRVIQLESQLRESHFQMLQLRSFLSGALCCHCGEPLGDSDLELIVGDDVDETIHKECESAYREESNDEEG